VQARVLGVTSEHDGYAESVRDALAAAGFRADWIAADEQLGKRIRSAKLERIPYVLVVGADDVRDGTVGVNPRGGEVVRGVSVGQFINDLRTETLETTVA
jgi:threonyl-tRNA synthetase